MNKFPALESGPVTRVGHLVFLDHFGCSRMSEIPLTKTQVLSRKCHSLSVFDQLWRTRTSVQFLLPGVDSVAMNKRTDKSQGLGI